MAGLLQDLRYSARRLVRAPAFALTAVLTLALGIGANTAVFSVVNAVLLKPTTGLTDPDRVVVVFTSDYSSSRYSASSYPDYEEFRALRDVFSDVAAVTGSPVNVVRREQPQRLQAEVVTSNYFSVLGVHPVAGRLLAPERPASAELVLSYDTWQSIYGGDRTVIGAMVQVNGRSFTVVGVAAPGFHGMSLGQRADAWLPLHAADHLVGTSFLTSRDARGLGVFARLAPGVTVERAQQRLTLLQHQLYAAYPGEWQTVRGTARDISVMTERTGRIPPDQRGAVFGLAGVLLAAVGFVLLICCANVANLLLARTTTRRREVAIRFSLGASRTTVLRQMFVESLLLAVVGGAAGLLFAAWTTDLLIAYQNTTPQPMFVDVGVDTRVLLFTVAVTALTAAAFGLAPGLQSTRTDLATTLKTERTLASGGGARLRDVLLAVQIALAAVLAVGAGLLTRTLQKAAAVDIGVNTERVVVARLDLRTQGYDRQRMREFYARLREELERRPEVAAVTYAQRVPVAAAFGRRGVNVPGYVAAPQEEMEFPFNVVATDYFQVMDVPIVQGRSFAGTDSETAPGTVIVNETFARRFWPAGTAVGRQLQVGDRTLEVVGVARDGKYWSVAEEPRPYFYLSAEQESAQLLLHVRARASEHAVMRLVRDLVRTLDPQLPITSMDTMERQIAGSLGPQRIAGGLLASFALLAVVLAGVGVYGVTSVLVAQRVPEIGLRVALGATRADVLRLVVGRALIVASTGIATGFAFAALGTKTLESLLFGIGRLDIPSFATAAAVVGLAALLAGYLPARRAARVDPLIALRS